MKTLASTLQILASGLLMLLGLGIVAVTVQGKGWFDGLMAPLVVGFIGAGCLAAGVMNARASSTLASVVGLVLTVPLFTTIGGEYDYETPGLVVGGVSAGVIALASIVHGFAAHNPTSEVAPQVEKR